MVPNPTSDPPSIFEKGRLKPGIYKIQNILSETYADIEVATRAMCCRPARDLEEGRGLVRRYPPSVVHISDALEVGNQKLRGWNYGAKGEHTNATRRNICHRALKATKLRLSPGNLNNFAR